MIITEYTWEDDDWVLAFRLTAGIRQGAFSTYKDVLRNDDSGSARVVFNPNCSMVEGSDGSCSTHYRSGLLNHDWEALASLGVEQV